MARRGGRCSPRASIVVILCIKRAASGSIWLAVPCESIQSTRTAIMVVRRGGRYKSPSIVTARIFGHQHITQYETPWLRKVVETHRKDLELFLPRSKARCWQAGHETSAAGLSVSTSLAPSLETASDRLAIAEDVSLKVVSMH